jgi:TonB-dependent SusC/RagA subfamily outer membrane receptor
MRALFLAVMLVVGAGARGRAQGTLTGLVRDGQSDEPLPQALVSVVGQDLKARTDDSGRFQITNVSPGVVNLRIEHDGFAAAVEQLDPVTAGLQPTFRLFPSATVLDAILVQARGSKRPSKDGASTTSVRPDERKASGEGTATDMVARIPGALILSGGQIGSGSIIRLRGVKSILGSGPPLIYIDGVRVSGGEPPRGAPGSGSMFRRYNEPSVLDQLDPASIDHIEVLPGSAATALYGTGGANGVILVFTKR